MSFSDGYKQFLERMGVPWFAIPLILSGSETLEMEIIDDGAGARTKTITGIEHEKV